MSDDLTRTLASFCASAIQPPAGVVRIGRRSVLEALGLAAVGADDPDVVAARQVYGSFGGPGRATVLWVGDRLPAMWAAATNASAVRAGTANDDSSPISSGIATVVPAALAVGELVEASTEHLIAAVCLGLEVTVRTELVCAAAERGEVWEPAGFAGHLGAAAAAIHLLGHGVETATHVLGLAGTQASGMRVADAMQGPVVARTRALQAGHAAGNAVEAALLAGEGFTAGRRIIDGRRGLGAVAMGDPDYAAWVGGLGDAWSLSADPTSGGRRPPDQVPVSEGCRTRLRDAERRLEDDRPVGELVLGLRP